MKGLSCRCWSWVIPAFPYQTALRLPLIIMLSGLSCWNKRHLTQELWPLRFFRRRDEEASQHHPTEHGDRHRRGDEEPGDTAGQQGLNRRQHQLEQLWRNVSIKTSSSSARPSACSILPSIILFALSQVCLPHHTPGAWEPVQWLSGWTRPRSDRRPANASYTPHG